MIYRHISFYTPHPRAQRVAPTSPVFQRGKPNLRSNTPILYRLFFVIANFNSIIFLITHKKNRAPRGVFRKILRDFSRGCAPQRHRATRAHGDTPLRHRTPPQQDAPTPPPPTRTHPTHTPLPHASRRGHGPRPLPSARPKERIGDTVCRSIYTLML